MDHKIRTHILISGRVQGVGYRYSASIKAKELGIFGWIKNLEDGHVEAVFEGEKNNVEKLIKWTKKGPFLSRVYNIEIVEDNYKGEFDDFSIIH